MRHRDDHRGCTCAYYDLNAPRRTCRWGNCVEFVCPACGRSMGGWGLMGCKCDGYVRWLFYPEMAPSFTGHAPVKPSKMARMPNRRRG